MRLIFFILIHISFPLATAAIARADDVESRGEHIISGRPVVQGESFGTVALVLLDAPVEADELNPVDAVGYLGCTGTLIAPTVVVTAAHCVDTCLRNIQCSGSDDPESCMCDAGAPLDGTTFVIVGLHGIDDFWNADLVPVRDVYIHESYDSLGDWEIDPSTGLSTEANDIAVLVLASPVTRIPSIPLLAVSKASDFDSGLAQGYGLKTQAFERDTLFQEDFESLLNEIESPIEVVAQRELLTSETDAGGTVCYGDSGGPLYVRGGGGVFLLGVASRSRTQDDAGRCEDGGVYTLAPAHADWIYEKAPEAISGSGGAAGARCSASPISGRPGPWIPLAALGVLVLVCVRRRLEGITVFGALAISLLGCGGDTQGAGGSLCTEAHDPLGVHCDAETARLDLQSAEAIARAIVPEDAWFWGAIVGSEDGINPDGEAELWLFEYYLPERSDPPIAELLSVAVSASGEPDSATVSSGIKCIPTRPIRPLSSEAMVHDAIRRLQSEGVTVQLGGNGILELYQAHRCSNLTDGWNTVTYDRSLVLYDESGRHLGFYQYPPEIQLPNAGSEQL